MAGHAQTNCLFLFMHNQSLLWWEPLASAEWIRKMSRWGNGLSCSILQVQDFHVTTKQQQEKPTKTKTCVTASPVLPPSPSPPSQPVWTGGPFSLCPVLIPAPSSPLINSPLLVIQYSLLHPHCHKLWLIALILSKLHKPGA